MVDGYPPGVSIDVEALERELARDLEGLGDRLVDESFGSDLYRALAGNRWRKGAGPEGALALSWTRAERLVNELRERRGEQPLELAQTGGEGDVADTVAEELGRLGWTSQPLDTSSHDPGHSAEPAGSPPPKGTGEQQSPVEDSRGWEREAHREAEAARRGIEPAPGRGGGMGAGGDSRVRSDKA